MIQDYDRNKSFFGYGNSTYKLRGGLEEFVYIERTLS